MIDYILKPGIFKGGITLLSGPPKVGKTTFLYRLMGVFNTKKFSYLLITDESELLIKERATQQQLDKNLITIVRKQNMGIVLQDLQKTKFDVVIIDIAHWSEDSLLELISDIQCKYLSDDRAFIVTTCNSGFKYTKTSGHGSLATSLVDATITAKRTKAGLEFKSISRIDGESTLTIPFDDPVYWQTTKDSV